MLIVLDKLPQVRDGTLLSFWIYRISKNAALKAARDNLRRRTENIDTKGNCAAEADGEAELLEHELELAFVRRALRELKPMDRQIVEQKYLKEVSISELQQHTGLSASAVKMRLLRARGQLLNICR
jgi:RNA polymerase sigma-70 factor (ECF subfamily)